VSGYEGAIGVVSNYEGGNFFSSKGSHQSADPVCGGAVRTARAPHHGTEDIVKNAGRNFHRFCSGKNDS
jgi:YHS domain-containing protein